VNPTDLDVRHHFVDLPGLRLHYVEAGEGPLVLLLHGFPETWWSWRYQIDALAKAGFRVVAPDQRGYGETDKTGPYDMRTVAADAAALIEALGEKQARVVGHDWGGASAWATATFHPERVERLAVLNCPHPEIMRNVLIKRPKLRQVKRSWYMFFFLLPLVPEWVLTRKHADNVMRMLNAASKDRSHFSSEETRPFRDGILRPGAAGAMVGWYRAALGGGLRWKRWPQIDARTLLLWGMDDPALGYDDLVPGTEAFAPHLEVKKIEGCGHFVQSERPDEVNAALIEYLKS